MKITLTAWAKNEFSPAPSIRTLRSWAKTGQIVPQPVKVGRTLMVEEDAVYMPLEAANCPDLSKRAQDILNGTTAPQ